MSEDKDRRRLSKFMSYVLRHKPEEAGLQLDARGFCDINKLLKAATKQFHSPVTREDVEALCVPSEDPNEKTRFELEGDFVRAGHGHSIQVSGYRVCDSDQLLYHATPRTSIDAIRSGGLRAMSRQKVHLSYDQKITVEAARRRSRDVVLVEVDVAAARKAGIVFYESADPRIILSDDIPPSFLNFDLKYIPK